MYITTLYNLVETFDYRPDIVDEILRDKLVVGMRDIALAEQLQMDPELTLEKVKKKMRQKQAVKEQNLQLQGQRGVDPGPVDAICTSAGEANDREPLDVVRTTAGGDFLSDGHFSELVSGRAAVCARR